MIPLRQRITNLLVGQQITPDRDDMIFSGETRLLHPRVLQYLIDRNTLQRVTTQKPL